MPKKSAKNSSLLELLSAQTVVQAHNPWWKNINIDVLDFQRDYFPHALKHTLADHGLALLINGPRRVGKTTLMRQLIKHLLDVERVEPSRIFFFSLQDPYIQQATVAQMGSAFERILGVWEKKLGSPLAESQKKLYCFLDEVQRLPNWELFIKRYVDLQYPIRFIVSGSASHTIFRKSLESLLGRMVDSQLPPFTFREWMRYHHSTLNKPLQSFSERTLDVRDRASVVSAIQNLHTIIEGAGKDAAWAHQQLVAYAAAGGFPQLWQMHDAVERSQFVDDQYVQRVALEDLRLIKEIRKPEIFHQLLRYAFARTGDEYNLERLASDIQTTRFTLAQALPLLLQTELIHKVERYRGQIVRLRSTHAKLYAVDLVLYEAVTKQRPDMLGGDKGRLGETLVFNVLRRLLGIAKDDITCYRTQDTKVEIDFIVRLGSALIPVEVKIQKVIKSEDISPIKKFIAKHEEAGYGLLVTEQRLHLVDSILQIPIALFLLLV